MRRTWVIVPLTVVTAALVGLAGYRAATSPAATPEGRPDQRSSAATQPVATIPSPGSTAPFPVPGASGDGYARNVTAGATCAPAGALGFTTQAGAVQCTTTAADPHLRWRGP